MSETVQYTYVPTGRTNGIEMARNTTRVQKKKNGQYVVTIPAGIAEGMELAGAKLSWNIASRDSLKVNVVKRGDKE